MNKKNLFTTTTTTTTRQRMPRLLVASFVRLATTWQVDDVDG